jgi:hypothetical protein
MNTKNLIICLSFLFCLPVISKAQDLEAEKSKLNGRKNAFCISLGSLAVANLNYERLFLQRGKHKFAGQVGFLLFPLQLSYAPFEPQRGLMRIIPLGVHWLYGDDRKHLELGINYISYIGDRLDGRRQANYVNGQYVIVDESYKTIGYNSITSLRVGYRWHKDAKSRFLFKIGLNLINFSPSPIENLTIKKSELAFGKPSRFFFLPIPELSFGWRF